MAAFVFSNHLNCELYYQQLQLKYLCNLARYWLEAPWGWHDSVETCRNMIICEIIVHLLVTVQNKKKWSLHICKGTKLDPQKQTLFDGAEFQNRCCNLQYIFLSSVFMEEFKCVDPVTERNCLPRGMWHVTDYRMIRKWRTNLVMQNSWIVRPGVGNFFAWLGDGGGAGRSRPHH
jgi:hypothetical protein